ncbi:MAG: Hsp20/alpha crystallin family protein [Pseudonocardiaceae bacterium]
MAVTTRWDAFHDLRGAQDQIDQMYALFAQARGQEAPPPGTGATSAPAWALPVDISERKETYVLTVELPGVKVEDLEIAFQDGLLTIQGERPLTQDSPDEQFHVLERRYGFFRRSITLPLHVEADAIEASTEDGVLQVVVPKVEEAKPKRIEVHAVGTLAPTVVSRSTTRVSMRRKVLSPEPAGLGVGPLVASFRLPTPTILGKDEAMHTMTLHAQADLCQHGTTTFAALFMEGEMRSPDTEDRTDVLLYAVMNRGLPLATDLPRLALSPRPGWAIHLNPAGALTLTWPHAQPLLRDAPLNLPTGWREAATEHGLVLLFVGDRLDLRDHIEGHQTTPGQRSSQAAERGELAAGAIAYPRQQQEPRPTVGRATGEHRGNSSVIRPYSSQVTCVAGS